MDLTAGGVLIVLAAVLWVAYLMPAWIARRRYIASHVHGIELQQTARVMAELSDAPEIVHVEANARSVRVQQRLTRELERAAVFAQETCVREAEAATHAAEVRARAARARAERMAQLARMARRGVFAAQRRRRARRVRLGLLTVALLGAVCAAFGLGAMAQPGGWLLLGVGGGWALGAVGLVVVARAARRVRRVQARRSVAAGDVRGVATVVSGSVSGISAAGTGAGVGTMARIGAGVGGWVGVDAMGAGAVGSVDAGALDVGVGAAGAVGVRAAGSGRVSGGGRSGAVGGGRGRVGRAGAAAGARSRIASASAVAAAGGAAGSLRQAWVPQSLPSPMHLSRGTVAAAVVASIEAAAQMRRDASSAELERRATKERNVVSVRQVMVNRGHPEHAASRPPLAKSRPSANPYARMGIVGDVTPAIDDVGSVLARRRRVG